MERRLSTPSHRSTHPLRSKCYKEHPRGRERERERERERGSVFAQGGFHPSALTTMRLQHARVERKQRGASLLSPRRNVWTFLTRSPHPPEEQVL